MADMNPEEMNAAPAAGASPDAPPAEGAPDPAEGDGGGDSSPLSKMEIEPAEDGGSIVTHHPKVPARVKNMDHEAMRPKKHVVTSHKDLVKHVEKHSKRLQA
jgi:hypothetical protein